MIKQWKLTKTFWGMANKHPMADMAPIESGSIIVENGDGRYKVKNTWGDLVAIVSKSSFDEMEKEEIIEEKKIDHSIY